MKIHLLAFSTSAFIALVSGFSSSTLAQKISPPYHKSPKALQLKRAAYAPPKAFVCGIKDIKNDNGKTIRIGVPTTVGKTDEGEVLIYHWAKPYYSDPSEDPLTRCKRVASILDRLNRVESLNLIKVGRINSKSAICASNSPDSPCSTLIFSLEPNEQPTKVLEDLRVAMKGLPVAPPNTQFINRPRPRLVPRIRRGIAPGGRGGATR